MTYLRLATIVGMRDEFSWEKLPNTHSLSAPDSSVFIVTREEGTQKTPSEHASMRAWEVSSAPPAYCWAKRSWTHTTLQSLGTVASTLNGDVNML